MEIPKPPPEIARAGLRALKTVALADGEFRPIERELIDAVMEHVLGVDVDLDALEPITPEELADLVEPQPFRERIVRGCAMLTLIDGDADDDERDFVTRAGKACGVKDKTLKAIKHYAKGQMRLLRLDVARRFIGADRMRKMVRQEGILGFFKTLIQALRKSEDTKLADRYRALGDLPEGTLGRGYFDFIRGNDFSLPGEVGAAPELITFHDSMHVLGGYGTHPEDEAQIAAFHAGQHGEDPFGMLLFSVMQFQLGVQITPAAEGYVGRAKPALLAKAFVRGSKCKGDLIRDWDPRDHWERPMAELRAELGIEPRDPA